MKIGFTGGSGTGKSTIAGMMGIKHIDGDKVYRKLLETNGSLRAELVQCFGTCERSELGPIVFGCPEKLQELNNITFKYIVDAIEKEIPENGNVIIDAPVLFESGLDKMCDVTIAVVADREVRIARIMDRDKITRERAEQRINAQQPVEYYLKRADHIVDTTDGDGYEVVQKLLQRMSLNCAIYGGTFDPCTLGHLDVIRRAAKMFTKLYVVVLINNAKRPVFSTEERVEMLKAATADIPNVVVESFDGLLVKYALKKGARYSIRGVRNGFDLEYERPMFEFNSEIATEEFGHDLETIFIPTIRENFDTSSSAVRTLLAGGVFKVVKKYVDPRNYEQIVAKYTQGV